METPTMKLSAVVVPDHKGRGYSGYFKEFPQALAFGKTTDDLYSNMFKSLEALREMNKDSEGNKYSNNNSNSIKEFELQLAS